MDETLYASYSNVYGMIVYEPHNGEPATVVAPVRVGDSILANAPANPTRPGYVFRGWFDAEQGGTQAMGDTLLLSKDGEIWHAQWQGNEQTVIWPSGDGRYPGPQKTESRSGEPYDLPPEIPVATNQAEDVRFYGWGREVGTNGLEVIAVYDWETGGWSTNVSVTTWTNAHEAVALWWRGCTFDPNGGVVESGKTWLYPGLRYDADAPLPTPSLIGYSFAGWSDSAIRPFDDSIVSDSTIVPDPPPTNLVATWKPVTVRVTLDANGGTNTVADSVLAVYSEPYGVFPTPTRPGYALEAWHYMLESGWKVTPETIVSNPLDHTVVASWTNAWYDICYKIGGTTVSGQGFVQRYGNPWPALYAPTQDEIGANKVFKYWELAETGEAVTEGGTALMTRSGALVAVIEGETCTLTFDAVDGVLDPENRTMTVDFGAQIWELPTPTRKDCDFLGWYTASGDPVTNGATWITSGTTALAARWKGSYAHRISFDGRRTVEPDIVKELECAYGDTLDDVSQPGRTDATFLGWWLDDVQCYDSDGHPLKGYETCPWERDVTLRARWAMDRDDFAGAFPLAAGVTNVVVGVGATDEEDEPAHAGDDSLRATHWYSFAVTNGVPVAVTFNDLSGVECPYVAIAVYSGDDLADLECIDSTVEYESFETTFEWTPAKTEVVHLALAQDGAPGEAGLSAYEIAVTGGGVPFVSAWTNPDEFLPYGTAEERNALALAMDGFSDDVSERVSPTKAYASFTAWAHVGDPAKEIPPSEIADKPNVVLASAYSLTAAPSGTVTVAAFEMTKTEAGETAMRITLRVGGSFAASGAKDMNLLVAAIGVKGSQTVGGTYSDDDFDCRVEAADTQKNEVRLLVTPKKADAFFVVPVTY